MHRIIGLLITFLLLSVSSTAQLKGGLKGGTNISNIIVTNKSGDFSTEIFKTRISYHLGSYVQQTFSPSFSWQIEMLFSNKGSKIETEEVTSEVSLNYINWPLLVVYNAGKWLDIEAGLEPGFLVSGDARYRGFDLGMDVGIRVDISQRINLGMRYCLGFPFDYKLEGTEYEDNPPKYQNNVLQVYFGFNLIQEIVSK